MSKTFNKLQSIYYFPTKNSLLFNISYFVKSIICFTIKKIYIFFYFHTFLRFTTLAEWPCLQYVPTINVSDHEHIYTNI